MNKRLGSLAALLVCLPLSVSAVEKSIRADDGFTLSTEYFAPQQSSGKAVLMLHQCNYNRTMYDTLGQMLADAGIHAISLDFRGFGKSTSEDFNVEALSELPEDQQRQAWQKLSSHWSSDTDNVLEFLHNQAGKNAVVGVIGASCGGSLAVRMSESNQFEALALFSSAQGEKNISRYKKFMSAKPTLIIAAQEDGNTYKSAEAIFANASHSSSKFVAYKGDAHGYPLYEQDKTLVAGIANWFESNLSK